MLYKAIDIWRPQAGGAIRYRCFEIISSGRFCVQSADFYQESSDDNQKKFLEHQFLELFIEQLPDQRSPSFQTLEEAISWHDKHFATSGDMFPQRAR